MSIDKIDYYLTTTTNLRANVKGARKLFKLLQDRSKQLFIAVDFHVIYQFLYPSLQDILSKDEFRKRDFLLKFYTRRFLFKIVPKLKDFSPYGHNFPLILLLPYAEEMKDVCTRKIQRELLQVCDTTTIKKFLDNFKDGDTYSKLINNKDINEYDENNIAELSLVIEQFTFCFEDEFKVDAKNTVSNSNHLGWAHELPFIHYDDLNHDRLSTIESHFHEKRRHSFSHEANIRDALALEYIISMEENLPKDQKVILITDSPVFYKVKNELKNDISSLKQKLLFRPEELAIFLMCLQDTTTATNIRFTDFSKSIKGFTNRFSLILDKLSKRVHKDDTILIGEYEKEFDSLTKEVTDDFFRFLKWFLYSEAYVKPERNHMKTRMLKKIYVDDDEIHSQLFDQLKNIISLGADKFVEHYCKSVNTKIERLGMLCGGVNNPFTSTFDSYFFTEYEYSDKNIHILADKLLSENITESIEAISEIHKYAIEYNYEARLLMIQFMSKGGVDDLSLVKKYIDEIEEKNDAEFDNILIHFKFILNIFYSRRTKAMQKIALRESIKLANQFGQQKPRLYLQAGYFSYRMYENTGRDNEEKNIHLIEAINYNEKAYSISKDNNSINCQVISIVNSILYNLAINRYEECMNKYIDLKLLSNKFSDHFQQVPVVDYVEGLVMIQIYNGNISTTVLDDFELVTDNIVDRLNDIATKLKNYLPNCSVYSKNKFRSFIKQVKELNK